MERIARTGDEVPWNEEPPQAVTASGISRQPVRRHRLLRVRSAFLALEDWRGHDFEVMTNGEFSVLDALLVLLDRAGRPLHLVVSTWSVGLYDLEVVNKLLDEGRLLSFRLMLDVSFRNSKGSSAYAGQIMPLFGSGSVRTIRSHAKFFLLHGDGVAYSLTSTANLNENKRLELMYFSDDPDRLAFYLRLTDEVFAEVEEGWNPDTGAPELATVDPVAQAVEVGGKLPVQVGRLGVDATAADGSRRTVQVGRMEVGKHDGSEDAGTA